MLGVHSNWILLLFTMSRLDFAGEFLARAIKNNGKSHRRIGQAPILDGRERGKHGCLSHLEGMGRHAGVRLTNK